MSFKIILADDHPLILTGLRSLIANLQSKCDVVAEAHQVSSLFRALQQHPCDLLITDFSMPGDECNDGLNMMQQLRRDYPILPIIVLTQIHNAGILQSLINLGVNGVLLKKAVIKELSTAISQVLSGQCFVGDSVKLLLNESGIMEYGINIQLTPKESEVVRLLANGMSVTQVAEYLHRSIKTISTQKKSAMQRLGLQSDSDLFHYARENGLL
ncbi:response regulator [Aeromonas bestiarum]|nr:response regulator [Aeromonas bestiarum]